MTLYEMTLKAFYVGGATAYKHAARYRLWLDLR